MSTWSTGIGAATEVLNAEPMSLRVSERALTVMAGAIAGLWRDGDNGGLVKASILALIRFSSTMVLSSLMASSTASLFGRRKLVFDDLPSLSLRLCFETVFSVGSRELTV
jgi:hypothetical protein